jgi:hypothetical protein
MALDAKAGNRAYWKELCIVSDQDFRLDLSGLEA